MRWDSSHSKGDMRMYFEEFTVGQKFTTGSYLLSKEEIIAYAMRYDPQDIHINEQKAKEGPFKGIIASGIHTLAIAAKLGVELKAISNGLICGVGCDAIRFVKPVYPFDMLTVYIEVLNCTPHTEKKDRGFVTFSYVAKNQRGEIVLTVEITTLKYCAPSLLYG